MALRYGVDTSILVRLVARQPRGGYERCLRYLGALVQECDGELLASNQAIGETYAALIHHYDFTSAEARVGLLDLLSSGLVAPLNGPAILEAVSTNEGPGLFDRLIADDYSHAGLETLTLDRQMASLATTQLLDEMD